MNNPDNELTTMSDDEIVQMLQETSQLAAKDKINQLGSMAVAAQTSNALTNEAEFWKWMNRNYQGAGIFDSNASMQNYIYQGAGKEEWMTKQLQGKGYEWDWMQKQRGSLKNLFKRYDAGDVANRAASDVTETDFLTGKVKEYQMKAYTGKTNPHLKNTPKDMTVVTNEEKIEVVRKNGYGNVEKYKDADGIKKVTDKRMEQIKEGKANTAYNFQNVAGTMAKAGIIGCVIGMGTEAVMSYKSWKNGDLSDDEYLKEVLKAGGDAGLTAAGTSGIMLPISAAITAAGVSSLVTIPIAFVVGSAVNKIIAPCFGRGQYRQVLNEAKYYQSIENVYDDFLLVAEQSANQYVTYVQQMQLQANRHNQMKQISRNMDQALNDLYDSI